MKRSETIVTGKELRCSLALKGARPSQLADHLGVSRSTVSRLLSGERKISGKYENAIIQFIGDVEPVETNEQKFEETVRVMNKEEKIKAIQFILETL